MASIPKAIIRPIQSSEQGIEPVYARTARTFARHFHDQFGIGVILSGAQRSASGRGPVEAGRGDVITVNPGEVHDGAPIGDEVRAWAMLYIDPDRVGKIALNLSDGRCDELELAHPVCADRTAAKMFRTAFGSLLRRGDPLAADEALVLLLRRLAVPRAGSGVGRTPPSGAGRARQAIDDDPAVLYSLEELASIAGIGRFRLIRAFAAETGMTPHAYAMQRRLQFARQLLRTGSPLARSAIEAGFADQSHMTRLFTRTYGMTPGAYVRARIQ